MMELGVLNTSTPQTLLSLYLNTLSDIVQVNLTAIVHKRSEGQGLSTGPCAVIQDSLLRFSVDTHR